MYFAGIGQVWHLPATHTFSQTCSNGPVNHMAQFARAGLVYVVHRANHPLHFCDAVMPRLLPQGPGLVFIF